MAGQVFGAFAGRGDEYGDEDGQGQTVEPFDPNKRFYTGKEAEHFDLVVREQVYNCLLYRGDMQMMMTEPYFTDQKYNQNYHFSASAKVPFYMIYFTSPHIQDELAAKYLENPQNVIMFAHYDQEFRGIEGLNAPRD